VARKIVRRAVCTRRGSTITTAAGAARSIADNSPTDCCSPPMKCSNGAVFCAQPVR
jgi:hypothetical protein